MSRTDERTPNHVDIHVGLRIRGRRKQIGVSQEKLATQLGLTFQQVQKYERGANRVSASKLFEICTALGVPVSYFFEGLSAGGTPMADGAASDGNLVALAACPGGHEIAGIFVGLDSTRRTSLMTVARALIPKEAMAA